MVIAFLQGVASFFFFRTPYAPQLYFKVNFIKLYSIEFLLNITFDYFKFVSIVLINDNEEELKKKFF